MKIKILNLRDCTGSNTSGEGEVMAELKKIVYITGEKNLRKFQFRWFFQTACQLGKPNRSPKY
jgi:hypothetical protein